MSELDWTVVVPAKPRSAAKSRLRGALPAVPHERLVLALAADTIEAVRRCPEVAEVLVVTDDPAIGDEVRAHGVRVVPDAPAAGLNAAFQYGAALAAAGHWVGALTADLPALRSAELSAALRAASTAVRHYLPDAPGSGTVLLTAAPGRALDPRFGPGSAKAHAASGAVALCGDWPTLRRDVDTPADLAVAARLGLGPRTDALVAAACAVGSGAAG
jgi:2-phospho-L-lactate guanylyltransferase